MIFSKDGLIRLLYTIGVSTIICLGSSLIFSDGFLSIRVLGKCIVVGVIIWFFSELLLDLVCKLWPYRILPSYIALFIIIGTGTSLGVYLIGVKSIATILIINLCGEICGFAITILYRRHYKKILNQQLYKIKNQQ